MRFLAASRSYVHAAPLRASWRGYHATRTTSLAHMGMGATSTRAQKAEGTIEGIFSTFTQAPPPLPQRFADLKKEIVGNNADGVMETWRQVLQELEEATADVAARKQDVIPQVDYASVVKGLSESEVKEIKKAGVVIVKGGVPSEEALAWKQDIRDYIKLNQGKVKGGPMPKIVFYELYNTPSQVAARSHPALIATQRALLSLWNTSSDPYAPISLSTPISYFDRLRIRPPGPSGFDLGCHMDGGSIERWEDPLYRKAYSALFEGGDKWREYDPFDASWRVLANQDLYNAPNQCSVFRTWQGWTSLSSTGPGNGTLRVLPFLHLATAYLMLRPFFRPRVASSSNVPLGFNDWELDLESTSFPGSDLGKAQILNEQTHPHLKLASSVVSIPRVEPGDQVYWHCDLVHAVESEHNGTDDSSVLYIPAVPLTVANGGYLRAQLLNFEAGLPPPDFPGGEGESSFKGRATPGDIKTAEARRLFGLEPYDIPENATPGAAEAIDQANLIIF